MVNQLLDNDMVDMMAILHNNFPLLWDLLNRRRKSEFSSEAKYNQLRNEIFTKLKRHVDPNINNFWSANLGEQEELMVDIIGSAQPSDWPNGHDEFTVHCHRHYTLLNDWGLKYTFSSTGHGSERFGVPKNLIDILERAANARKIVDTELKNFHLTQQFAEIKYPHVATQSLANSSTLASGLFYSPTAQAMRSPQRPLGGSYHNSNHDAYLRRPFLLSRRFDGDSDEDRKIRKYLYLARQGLQSGHPSTFRTVISRAVRLNTCAIRKQWLSDYAELASVLDYLDERENELKTDIDDDFGCQFCNRVGWANVLMLKERLVPVSEDDQSINKMMVRNIFHHDHKYSEIDSSTARFSSRQSFECQVQRIAREIDIIINPKKYYPENGGRRPQHRFPIEGRTALGDITNIANNNTMG